MERLTLKVVTPEGLFLETDADLVELPTDVGEIGVFPGHLPLIAGIGVGEMRVFLDGEINGYALAGGFARITARAVEVLATFAGQGGEEMDVEAACERARQALQELENMSAEAADAEVAALQSQLTRLVKKRRRP